MRKLILLIALLVAVPAFAQERPIAGTTVQTTDTTANSVLVGCAVGSTTCTGGIKAGPITASTGAFTGAITVTGGTAGNGTITKSAGNGFFLTGVTGSSFDFVIGNPGGGSGIMLVPTGTTQVQFGNSVSLIGNVAGLSFDANGTNGLGIGSSSGSGALRFYAGNALRWGVNAAGDHTFGASSHIADSSGTPTYVSGIGTTCTSACVSGTDYAIRYSGTGSTMTAGVIAFGHTFSAAPACVISSESNQGVLVLTTSTTQVTIGASIGLANGWIMCRGF